MTDNISHYGVPGMKWGVRKTNNKSKKPPKDGSWAALPAKDKKKVAAVIVATEAVAIGAATALVILSRNGNQTVRNLLDNY